MTKRFDLTLQLTESNVWPIPTVRFTIRYVTGRQTLVTRMKSADFSDHYKSPTALLHASPYLWNQLPSSFRQVVNLILFTLLMVHLTLYTISSQSRSSLSPSITPVATSQCIVLFENHLSQTFHDTRCLQGSFSNFSSFSFLYVFLVCILLP